MAAISFAETFFPAYPAKRQHEGQPITFEISDAWVWGRDAHVRPFEFLLEYDEQRKAIKSEAEASGVYNFMEMVLKLILNTVYGKTAQRRGREGKVPPTYNLFYAAAITAYCRRRVLEAALVKPFSIVQFATDGIVSDRAVAWVSSPRRSMAKSRPNAFDRVGRGSLDRVRDIGDEVFSAIGNSLSPMAVSS